MKGSDANSYAEKNPNSLIYVGNGWLLYDRDFIFKNSSSLNRFVHLLDYYEINHSFFLTDQIVQILSGVGVKIKYLNENYFIPSLDSLDESKYFLQNLPSIVCAKVLYPQTDERILDLCAAPGGKTSHIAELVDNQVESSLISFFAINYNLLTDSLLTNK